jgi:hypothetical protein
MLRFAKPDDVRGIVPGAVVARRTRTSTTAMPAICTGRLCSPSTTVRWPSRSLATSSSRSACGPVPPFCGQDSRGRLAVAAYRRCMERTGSPPARSPRAPACRTAGCAGPGGLTARERGVLGLVLFGGLGHRQAGPDLGIFASDTAALPRAALGSAAAAMSRSSRP